MYDIPEDCLLAYDPDCVDLHSNSSDFQDTRLLKIAPKNGNHSLFNRKRIASNILSEVRTPCLINKYNSKITKSTSQVFYESTKNDINNEMKVHESYTTTKSKVVISQKQIEIKRTEWNKKVPCLAGLFKLTNNHTKSRSSITETRTENRCQKHHESSNCSKNKLHQTNHRYHTSEPVYTVETSTQNDHFKPSKECHRSNKKPCRYKYSNNTYGSTSPSETIQTVYKIVEARRNGTQHVENSNKRCGSENNSQVQKRNRHNTVNSTRHRRKYPFEMCAHYTNTQQYTKGQFENSRTCSCGSVLPSTYSGFWDSVYNKINSKLYCKCRYITSPCCNSCSHLGSDSNEIQKSGDSVTCACDISPAEETPQTALTDLYAPPPAQASSPPIKLHNAQKSKRPNKTDEAQTHSPPMEEDLNSCQMNHDEMIAAINERYKGEIVCIHNPPCIVINGCLTLPPMANDDTPQTTPLPVKEKLTTGYDTVMTSKCIVNNTNEYRYRDQTSKQQFKRKYPLADNGCQTARNTVNQFQGTELMTLEKSVQCYCSYGSPCGVRRKSCKSNYDPIIKPKCLHVPMCENIPMCKLDSSLAIETKTACRHKPVCVEVPKCSADYVVLNAKGESGTQLQEHNRLVCNHQPRCIVVPKCIAQMYASGTLPPDRIPNCVHQTPCEMIPACCGKSTQEMDTDKPSVKTWIPVYYQNKLLKLMNVKRSYRCEL